MPYFVYIIQSEKDGSYYIGSTQDLEERLDCHNQGRSQYTKIKRPWKLVCSEEYSDRSSAVKRESEIKRHKKKDYIETLVSSKKVESIEIYEDNQGVINACLHRLRVMLQEFRIHSDVAERYRDAGKVHGANLGRIHMQY